jgi:hypothetical protein
MKIDNFFTQPGIFYKFDSEGAESSDYYKRPILGAVYEETKKGIKKVTIFLTQSQGRTFTLDKGSTLIPAGPSFIFKSEKSFYSVGPFESSDVDEVFDGLPMTVPMMEELFGTPFRVKVEVPESSESSIKRLYIQKEDGSFYVKSGKGWEDSLEAGEPLSLVEISLSKGASIA